MVKGFYNLASGMLTQRRNLDVISSNMANVSTPGFRGDQLVSSTFGEEMMSRTGNTDKSSPAQLADVTMARIPRETVTDFTTGNLRQTGKNLDIAIRGEGFFQIERDGQILYTRAGSSLNLDNEGYICMQNGGRLLGKNGPIRAFDPQAGETQKDGTIITPQFAAENIHVNVLGGVYDCNGVYLDQIDLVAFVDESQLVKDGVYFTGGQPVPVTGTVLQGVLEESNVNMTDEMLSMMESERHLQSAAQILKMYDQMLAKATTEIGRIN